MSKLKNILPKSLGSFLILLIFLFGVIFLTFNSKGIIKYYKLKREIDSLNVEIKNIQSENKKLFSENDSLEKKIPSKIEQVAREKYGFSKKNETKIKIVESPEDK
ncbi:MAG: hypothetical protein STSR0008_12670 [Ignavibacterium sp.]